MSAFDSKKKEKEHPKLLEGIQQRLNALWNTGAKQAEQSPFKRQGSIQIIEKDMLPWVKSILDIHKKGGRAKSNLSEFKATFSVEEVKMPSEGKKPGSSKGNR